MLDPTSSINDIAAADLGRPSTYAAPLYSSSRTARPRTPDLLAFVVAPTGPERFAATTVFRRDGYRVHETDSLSAAVRWFVDLGPAHPLLRNRPMLFVTSDNAGDDLESLGMARAACPDLFIIVATDHFCSVDPADFVALPRHFTSRQIREVLDGSS